jgi:hypothetical protein
MYDPTAVARDATVLYAAVDNGKQRAGREDELVSIGLATLNGDGTVTVNPLNDALKGRPGIKAGESAALTMAECIAVAMEIHRLAAEACRVANTATSREVTDARD